MTSPSSYLLKYRTPSLTVHVSASSRAAVTLNPNFASAHGAEHADASVAAGVEQDLPFPVHLHDVLVEYLHHGHAVVPLDVSGSMPIHLLALC